jgi:hypothetical protein
MKSKEASFIGGTHLKSTNVRRATPSAPAREENLMSLAVQGPIACGVTGVKKSVGIMQAGRGAFGANFRRIAPKHLVAGFGVGEVHAGLDAGFGIGVSIPRIGPECDPQGSALKASALWCRFGTAAFVRSGNASAAIALPHGP